MKKEIYMKNLCPVVDEPDEDCYFKECLTSRQIVKVVDYCLNNYEKCEIYKRRFMALKICK